MVRCWSHAERSLVSTALWPQVVPENMTPELEQETIALRASLTNAGPETLLVVIGPQEGAISEERLDWARQVVKGLVKRHMRRLPVIRRAIVTRFWPLTLLGDAERAGIPTPSFAISDMVGELEGESETLPILHDEDGRETTPPDAMLLLNAAVVKVVVSE